jgi:putative xylitol transport system permease protein
MVQIPESNRLSVNRFRYIIGRLLRNENAILFLAFIAVVLVLSIITGGLSIRGANLMNILVQSSIRGVASVGQAFVILTAGIDVSVGGIGLMCAVLGASLMTSAPYLSLVGYAIPVFLSIPIMLLAGVAWGAANGFSVSRIGMPPLIVTLAMWGIATGVAFLICGGRSIPQLPDSMAFFGQGNIAGVPVPIIIFAVVAAIGYVILHHTAFGRSVYATGGNSVSAWLSGINVKNIQFATYVISGFLAGLAAVIMTGRVMSASMQTLAGLELDSIAAVCVGGVSLAGGKGSLIGVIIGVLLIGVINNGMSILGADPAVMGIVKGGILFGAVAADYIRRQR